MLSFIFALAGLGVFVCFLAVAISLATYILYAIPLYQMASKAELENAWLAWIPVAQVYVLCMLAKNEADLFGQIKFSKRENAFWSYLIILIAGSVLSFIPFVSMLSVIACAILMWKFNYDVINTYANSSNAMVIAVIGTIIPLVMTIELWMIRKNKPDYVYLNN